MTMVLHEQGETTCASARRDGSDLWLSASDLEAATGWSLKPEGLCKGAICLPISPARRTDLVRNGAINTSALWQQLGHPVVHDDTGETWVLGTGAGVRTAALESLEAPDFTLPDLAGLSHTLVEHQGKKVLIATWASW